MRIRRVKHRILANGGSLKLKELEEQRAAARNSEIHHFIGTSKQNPVWLADLSQGGRFSNDPASMVSEAKSFRVSDADNE